MPDRSPTASGGLIALLSVVGAIAGGLFHQASAGLLAGIAIGSAIAVGLWLRERRRIGR